MLRLHVDLAVFTPPPGSPQVQLHVEPRALELEVIAEGVETPQQLAALRVAGAALGQGFLLGPPAAAVRDRAALVQPRVAPSV